MRTKQLATWILIGLSAGLLLAFNGPGAVARPHTACPDVPNTTRYTIAYGLVTLNGSPAEVGSRVLAYNPRNDLAGCFEITSAGNYGMMYIYGEDAQAVPPIPGMRDGESVSFVVEGAPAQAAPAFTWVNDWAYTTHAVTLTAMTETIIWISPAESTGRVGTPLTLTAAISEATNLGGFQFTLAYSPTLIRVQSVTIGPFLGSTGRGVLASIPVINPTAGTATFIATTIGTAHGAAGSGTLAEVVIVPQSAGNAALQWQNVQISATDGTPPPLDLQAGSITIKPLWKVYLPVVIRN